MLATKIWTGAGLDDHWTNAANWQNGNPPGANDDLIFPAGADNLANTTDFPANTSFGSIQLAGPGYALAGNAIVLGVG